MQEARSLQIIMRLHGLFHTLLPNHFIVTTAALPAGTLTTKLLPLTEYFSIVPVSKEPSLFTALPANVTPVVAVTEGAVSLAICIIEAVLFSLMVKA